jgi:predicted acetyltransferase
MKLLEKTITYDGNHVGYICILTYPNMDKIPYLQYGIKPEYENQGIASREVSLFLKDCKKNGFNQICAMCKDDNIASIRVLMKNNFIEYVKIRNIITYLTDLRLDKPKLREILETYERKQK